MARRVDAEALRLVVVFLRFKADMTQMELASEARVDQSSISDFERGEKAPREEVLRRMARATDVPWYLVAHLKRFFVAVLSAARRGSATAPDDRVILETALLAMRPYLIQAGSETASLPVEELIQEAQNVWTGLEDLPVTEIRSRIETAPDTACRSWAALVRTACEASVRAAAESADAALELADLTLAIAERVRGDETAQAAAHAWGHIANARRVANDFDGSDEAFARAWNLRRAAATDSVLFPDWRLLLLEASLRRAQLRFPEALDRLDTARALSGGDRLVAGRILLQKSNVFEQMGDSEAALAALDEAAPLLVGCREPRLLAVLHFNRTDNLCRLERFKEAARSLPEVLRLAAEQANGLDLTRTAWLEAKVMAGLGAKDDATAQLLKVRDAFTAEELAYDAALVSLDLAILRLEAGYLAEVRELAEEMAWIFQSKKIHREALAALALFCEAAKREAATVALTRQVIADVEKARSLAS